MQKVLVTDASERAALAVIRSLGKKGIEVVAADDTSFNAGFLSKYCNSRVVYPSPKKDKSRFAEWLMRLVKNEDFDLLIPVTDFTMVPVLERKEEFEDYVRVAAPPYEVAVKALDKIQTIQAAKKCGVPVPESFIINDIEEVKEVSRILKYPVVIKPRMKVLWIGGEAVVLKVTPNNYAYNVKDFIRKFQGVISRLDKRHVLPSFFIIQEFAGGSSYGVEVLMSSGKLISVFMHKRLREYPITGGASTLRTSVWNKKLAEYALRLLKYIGWEGVAMVEFKVNETNSDVKLMEVNGRFWGSLPLAISSGVDFPYLLYNVLVKNECLNSSFFLVGMKQRWLVPGELLWLYSTIVEEQSLFKALKDFLGSFAFPDDILSLEDPAPILGALKTSICDFREVLRGKRAISGEIL